MKRGIIIAVFVGILTLSLATPVFAQTSLPNPPFDQAQCFEMSGKGAPFTWDVTSGKCVISPPHR